MRIIGLLLALLISPAVAVASCVTDLRTTVPLRIIGGVILLTVEVNDGAGLFILDTGAARSVVTRAAVSRLNLARDPWVATSMRGVSGVERLPNANPASIRLGGVTLVRRTMLRDHSLTVASLPRTEIGGQTIDGLLGRDFLSLFDLALDLRGQTLTLIEVRGCAGRFLPWTVPYTALAVENPADSALVMPVMVDGVALRALLDTGASKSLIAAPGITRLGLTEAVLAGDPSQTVSGVGPRGAPMRRHRFNHLHSGTLRLDQPIVWVAPLQLNPIVDMLLGTDILADRLVWISFATRQVFVAH